MPQIVSLGASAPQFRADNAHVRDLVLQHSDKVWSGNGPDLAERLDLFFERSGADARAWRTDATPPIVYLKSAVAECLDCAPAGAVDQIACVIYCGVDKSIAEPAHASVIAAQIGLPQVRAFDVSDACMGWLTACTAARAFVSAQAPYALILSAEFPMEPDAKIVPGALRIETPDAFRWKASALTMGEAATATLIDATAPALETVLVSQNHASDLCVVPLTPLSRIYGPQAAEALGDYDCFMADAFAMTQSGYRAGVGVLRDLLARVGPPDQVIPHSFSATVPQKAAEHLGVSDRLRLGFPLTGNLATSSIPYALHSADRGGRTLGWTSSAGMKHAAFQIGWSA